MKKTFCILLVSVLLLSCEAIQEEKRDPASAATDFYGSKFPSPDSISYNEHVFSADMGEPNVAELYKLMVALSTPNEIDLCHELPHGGNIEIDVSELSTQSLAKSKAICDQLAMMMDDTIVYQEPGSIALLKYDPADADQARLARVYDRIFSLEEKVWLKRIGGNRVILNESIDGFRNQMALKLHVKLLFTQKIIMKFLNKPVSPAPAQKE